ncbi:MAG: hypothetical protein ACP6KW_11590 [Candidatus Thorarchaeota archaeon]
MGMIERLYDWSTLRNLLLSLGVTLVSGAPMMLIIIPQMNQITGGLTILDTRMFYSLTDMSSLFAALGGEGMNLYVIQKVVDTAFPLGYGLAFALAQGIILKRISLDMSRWRYLVLLPITALLLDLAENFLTWSQMAAYPNLSEPVVIVAAASTFSKWTVLGLTTVVLIATAALALVRSRKTE